jgi:hypothetical protein
VDDDLPGRLGDAAAALDPEPEALERSRSASLAAFSQLQASGGPSGVRPTGPGPGTRLRWLPQGLRHPVVASILAAAVVLGGGAGLVAAASGPGQPFFGLRLAVERLTLPPSGTAARLEVDLDRLGTHVADARQANQRGDAGALADTMTAYQQTLEDTLDQEDVVAAQLARTRAVFDQQVQVLQQLLTEVPASARPGVTQALTALQQARLDVGPAPGRSPADDGSGNGNRHGNGRSNPPSQDPGATPPGDAPPAGATSAAPSPSPPGTSPASSAATSPPAPPTPSPHPSSPAATPGHAPGAP